ncbi:hypothetical protein Y886_11860 [Xanthomonas hyacinthi DSM 19077]|nr:hypothetical protein Y886_11860 [Xanthomonas hyacinthi DSM 19077]
MPRSIVFLALSTCLSPAFAVELGEHFTLSGFGTLAALRTDTDDARYIRESQNRGAGDALNFATDSNFGLQLTGKANDWLSATVQTVTKRRSDAYNATQVDWAFVKVQPIANLSVRAGLTTLPTFAISDSRSIGYANPWIHAPNEVYGIAFVDRLTGVDASYAHDLGGGTVKLTVLAGSSQFTFETGGVIYKQDMKRLRGASLQWENDWLSLRAGRVQGRPQLPAFFGADNEVFTFDGFGAVLNHSNVLLQAEYVMRRSDKLPALIDADAWYVLGGYRIGDFQPFVSYAKLDPADGAAPSNGRQTTTSLGLRWDFHRSFALKGQWDMVDTHGTPGVSFNDIRPGFDGKVNVFALALDFVF